MELVYSFGMLQDSFVPRITPSIIKGSNGNLIDVRLDHSYVYEIGHSEAEFYDVSTHTSSYSFKSVFR